MPTLFITSLVANNSLHTLRHWCATIANRSTWK